MAVIAFDEFVGFRGVIGDTEIPPHLEPVIFDWSDNFLEPIINKIIEDLAYATPQELVTPLYVNRLNEGLKKLATLQAYYEFLKLQNTTTRAGDDEVLINTIKIEIISKSKDLLIAAFEKGSEGIASNYTLMQISFTPSSTTQVSGKPLEWGRATVTGSYLGFAVEGVGSNTGGTTTTAPPPPVKTTRGGTTPVGTGDIPGGTTTANPHPTQPQPQPQPTSPGTIRTTVSPVAVTTNPATTTTQTPATAVPAGENNNKKYWIMGTALAVAALIFRR